MSTQSINDQRKLIVTIAKQLIGNEEIPRGSNWGPAVERFLKSTGLTSPAPWCMAFAVNVVADRAGNIGNLVRTASCQAQVTHAKSIGACISMEQVVSGKLQPVPGDLFCEWEDALNRYAHSGIVTSVDGLVFQTVEGNTNDNGGREGYAVLPHSRNAGDRTGEGHEKYCFIRTFFE